MNLLFARSNKYSYSETFLDSQIKYLKPKIVLYEGWYPSILPNGKSFLPFPLNLLVFRGTLRNLFPKFYHKIFTKLFSNYLDKQKIDVVFANYGPMGSSLMDACERSSIKLFVQFLGFDATEYKILEQYGEAYKILFEKASGIIVVSNDMKKQLVKLGANGNKIMVNSCGVEIDKFKAEIPKNVPPIFISVARFTAKKGPNYTIKAFAKVVEKIPNAKLIMVGDGGLLEKAKELAGDLKIENRIEFLGKKSPAEIVALQNEARVFVQHSMIAESGDSEGTPVAILEASASGLPIISTFHGGIKDAVIHEKTGYLVNEGDWETMANFMIELANDANKANEMGLAGRKHIEENYEMINQIQKLKVLLAT
jgi:colanic acid/amylovoran biosynthesis glycosyltransferase